MNEREMLLMAAKAAGIPQEFAGNDAFMDGVLEQWNPLHDDGDALRLAVRLRLGISLPIHESIQADVISFIDSSVSIREQGCDPFAAARLAITRAAAQIGKSMP